MSSIEASTPSASFYIGHVRNGVVVLDSDVPALPEGQTVRVEPVEDSDYFVERKRIDALCRLRILFKQWTDEDSLLLPDDSDQLRLALNQNKGLTFRRPGLP